MPGKNYFLQHSPSAFSAQQDFVESHFSAQQFFVESHASAAHFSVQPAQAEASVVAAAASPSAVFLFELPQQLTIATAATTTIKEKIFFISVKGLIINYSVTQQRYIFAGILQIKIFNIFSKGPFSANEGRGCLQTMPSTENEEGNSTFQFKRSVMENSSFFTNALGNVAATLPFRMIASSEVRQFPTATLK